MRKYQSVIAAGFGLTIAVVLAQVPLRAHHAFAAEFDADKPVHLEGTLIKMEWVNPHAWLHIEVKRPDGKVEVWMVEGGTPNTLLRRGFTKNSLSPGSEVVVEGYQAKDGSMKAGGRDVTFTDGRKLFLGGSAPTER